MSWEKLMSEKVPEGKTVEEVILEINEETKERRFRFVCKETSPSPKPKPDDEKDWRSFNPIPGVFDE